MYLKDEEWKFSYEAEVRNCRFGDVYWARMPSRDVHTLKFLGSGVFLIVFLSFQPPPAPEKLLNIVLA